ncbi:hypothetical protein [Rhizobium sp. Root1203]|nr:hypothetical protein [Rhizobium sp. Root1203]
MSIRTLETRALGASAPTSTAAILLQTAAAAAGASTGKDVG